MHSVGSTIHEPLSISQNQAAVSSDAVVSITKASEGSFLDGISLESVVSMAHPILLQAIESITSRLGSAIYNWAYPDHQEMKAIMQYMAARAPSKEVEALHEEAMAHYQCALTNSHVAQKLQKSIGEGRVNDGDQKEITAAMNKVSKSFDHANAKCLMILSHHPKAKKALQELKQAADETAKATESLAAMIDRAQQPPDDEDDNDNPLQHDLKPLGERFPHMFTQANQQVEKV